MIRHTASNALLINAFSADEKEKGLAEARARKLNVSTDDTTNKASIAALIKIACNTSNSPTLRDMVCERLGEQVAHAPKFAAFAAGELFAKRDAGTPAEAVFDALLQVIRAADIVSGPIFEDAVDAICEVEQEDRAEAASRVLVALRIREIIFTHTPQPEAYFLGSSV